MTMGGTLRAFGGGSSSRDAVHSTIANHVLAVGGSIITSATDVSNGIRVVMTNPAVADQLPNSGAAVWLRPLILGQDGLPLTWYPALDRIEALVLERVPPSVTPGLVKFGWLCCNFSDPSSVSCTEGFGFFLRYPSTDVREVGTVRITGAGTWGAAVGTGGGSVSIGGVSGTMGGGGQQVVRNVTAMGTFHDGFPLAPQANNFNVAPAADAVQSMTQQRVTNDLVTWYEGPWVGWAAAGGTGGCAFTFDPMYWVHTRPGLG